MLSYILLSLLQIAVLGPIPARSEATPMSRSLLDSGFSEIGHEHEVKVFRDEEADAIDLAAEGNFAHPPEKVLELLLDYPSHVGLVDNLSEIQVLETGPNWILVYEKLTLPVIRNRDYNLLVKWGTDGDTTWIVFDSVENRGLEPSGAVRVLHHHGSWQLQALPGNRGTRARFQFSVDFGGVLPMWMVSSGAADALPTLFESFRSELARRR
jgi:hypothetical protein